MHDSVSFTLAGTVHTISRGDVVERLADVAPEGIRKHWVLVNETRYPVTQAMRVSIGVGGLRIRSDFALVQFETLGFATSRRPELPASRPGHSPVRPTTRTSTIPKFPAGYFDALIPKFPAGYFDALIPKFPAGYFDALIPKLPAGYFDALIPKFPAGYFDQMVPAETVLPDWPLANSLPKFEVFPEGYLAKILPKIELFPSRYFESYLPKFDFEPMLRQIKDALPPNWAGDLLDVEKAAEVINTDGIPLVWVPRIEIIHALFEAVDRTTRIGILVERRLEISEDCRAALSGISHPQLAGQLPLILRALDAFDSDHYESAMALATVATETAVNRRFAVGYNKIREQVTVDFQDLTISTMRLQMALAPLALFYTPWWANSGEPKPAVVSRHVSVHFAHVDDYTQSNALLVLMIAVSVLRGLEEAWAVADPVEKGAQ